MAVTVTFDMKMRASETIALNLDYVEDQSSTHDIGTVSGVLSGDVAPVVSKAWSNNVTLSGGTLVLDLTALPQGNLSADVDFDTLKVQMFKFTAASGNSAAVVIADDATNGYNIFGDASGQVALFPGDTIMWKGNETLDDVAGGSADEIIFTSTHATAIVACELVAG